MNNALLMIFVKNPIPGKVKTRLASAIGAGNAMVVYQALLEHTHRITKDLACDKIVYYSDTLPGKDIWNNGDFEQAVQAGADLGEKMLSAFTDGFQKQYRSVVIIGSDCLELTPQIIGQAFTELKSADAVIGPARDGGYYLLGTTRLYPRLFAGKNWSTGSVFTDTLRDLTSQELRVAILPALNDIDRLSDLKDTALEGLIRGS